MGQATEGGKRVTQEMEIALAVLLWRNYRAGIDPDLRRVAFCKRIDAANECALRLAEKLQVKKEYLFLLLSLPVTKITFVELEKWEENSPFRIESSDLWRPIVPPKRPRGKTNRSYVSPFAKSAQQPKPKKSSKASPSKSSNGRTTKSRR